MPHFQGELSPCVTSTTHANEKGRWLESQFPVFPCVCALVCSGWEGVERGFNWLYSYVAIIQRKCVVTFYEGGGRGRWSEGREEARVLYERQLPE